MSTYCVRVKLRAMASQPATPTKATCQFQRDNGEWCKRGVALGESKCWQHARSWKRKWKSLTRNQTILFAMAAVALVIGVPAAWFTYDSWRIARQQTSRATTASPRTPSPAITHGDSSPANTGDGNTFIYGSNPQRDQKKQEKKSGGTKMKLLLAFFGVLLFCGITRCQSTTGSATTKGAAAQPTRFG